MKEKHPFKMKTYPNDVAIELFLPLTITWERKNYEGIVCLKLSTKSEILDYGIEWLDKAPNFGSTEIETFQKIEDDLIDKIYNRLKNIIENLDLSELEIT